MSDVRRGWFTTLLLFMFKDDGPPEVPLVLDPKQKDPYFKWTGGEGEDGEDLFDTGLREFNEESGYEGLTRDDIVLAKSFERNSLTRGVHDVHLLVGAVRRPLVKGEPKTGEVLWMCPPHKLRSDPRILNAYKRYLDRPEVRVAIRDMTGYMPIV